MNCKKCGVHNENTASFCSKCGDDLAKQNQEKEEIHPLAYYSIIVGIIITLVIFVFSLIINLNGGGKTKENRTTTSEVGSSEKL